MPSEKDVQYWLVELGRHGKITLVDGSHSTRDGADKALYLTKRLGLSSDGKKYAIAKIEITSPDNKEHEVNEEAISCLRSIIEGPLPPSGEYWTQKYLGKSND